MYQLILERIILSAAFFTVFIAIAGTFVVIHRRRVQSGSGIDSLASIVVADTPTLLYFWTTSCGQCKPQEREIERVRATLQKEGRTLAVHKVNALQDLELAKSMRVMTVPTTVLLDVQGKVAAWNAGFAPALKILDQVKSTQ